MQPAARQTGQTGSASEADRKRSIRETARGKTASSQPQSQHTCSSREQGEAAAAGPGRAGPGQPGRYLQGPLGQVLPALRLLLDEADVEPRGGVALLHLQQPLDDTPARRAGVPAGPEPGRACGQDAGPVLVPLLIHLLTPQRH